MVVKRQFGNPSNPCMRGPPAILIVKAIWAQFTGHAVRECKLFGHIKVRPLNAVRQKIESFEADGESFTFAKPVFVVTRDVHRIRRAPYTSTRSL